MPNFLQHSFWRLNRNSVIFWIQTKNGRKKSSAIFDRFNTVTLNAKLDSAVSLHLVVITTIPKQNFSWLKPCSTLIRLALFWYACLFFTNFIFLWSSKGKPWKPNASLFDNRWFFSISIDFIRNTRLSLWRLAESTTNKNWQCDLIQSSCYFHTWFVIAYSFSELSPTRYHVFHKALRHYKDTLKSL